ncbi:amidohydrolase family protein [Pseudonocardia sp.]|jgi:predicted TIM-barrel fold metal-dependent hydrolase|uniref:amidohydrolase family protein n=1 Tax=Pseudonocardia sp. TaxID=60912 RepID=UPI002D7E4657|nr:amidohydrolase family protein [Pseudonocardia sp.]
MGAAPAAVPGPWPEWVGALRLIDHHCHSVVGAALDPAGFGALLTEAPAPAPGADPFDSAVGLAVRRECAPVLDLPAHAPAADYLARRAELGVAEVTRRLFAASGTARLLVDHGYRGDDLLGLDELASVAAAPVDEVVRLEAVAEQLADAGVSAEDYPDALATEVHRRAESAVGCKSILAYRYGFDVDPSRPSPAQVGVATDRWLTQRARDRAARRIADPVLLRHALWCGVDAGLPVQLHTGFGDPEEDLHRANPALLAGFCRATEDTGTAIVLLHCYPYHREAAWLAHCFRHVYLDVGLATTYVGYRASAVLAEVLELAPFGKVLYSSDAFGLPELYLVAARAFRRAVSEVLGGWQHSGEAAEADVLRIARMISEENARRLYRLPVAA